ncbi:hypothetical protein DFJ67_7772 [Asanoa ferruginea]|uniref:Uncharacterized protein n=1 Tax=Asanoa ferruginea TaxID=53367 RepID=A0A3D9ZWZ2_9ACTN|nr:hypothetical protein [Asanoa ferruginea]REG01686.1 hypothetical protein DFJ67_7772 [Asanoa ferruginea]GIF51697.1 hypothetical protein Afe04nite_62360 [Asanoa ferruginea]
MAVAQSTVVTGRWQRQTWAEQRWPHTAGTRWLLRLGLALPFAGLTLFATGFDTRTDGLAPLPALIAGLVPGGAVGVSLATCLVTGIVLAALGERLIGWNVPVRIAVPLLVPAMGFAGSQDLTAILTVAFLAFALEAFVQFAVAGQTEGAFHAGLLLAAAALCTPLAVVFAVALGVVAPFVAAERGRAEPATWLVLSFPALAALAGWAFLDWIFTGVGDLGLDPAFGPAFEGTLLAVAHTPLYVAVGVLFAVRRPRALAGYVVPVLGILVGLLAGLPSSGVTAYLLLTVVALVAVPRSPSRRLATFLGAVALAQWALALSWPPTSAAYEDWLRVVWGL